MRIGICGITLALMLLAGSALASPLATDINAYNDGTIVWRGVTTMGFEKEDGKWLLADVDWCVYRGSAFTYGSYTTDEGTYTPQANEFVYAYQVHPIGDLEVTSLAVDMMSSNEAEHLGYFQVESTDEIIPDYMAFGGTYPDLNTANWELLVNPGESSIGLVYVSVNAPKWEYGYIQDGGTGASDLVPSPSNIIPEPATISLLLAGAGLFIRRKRSS